MRSASASRDDCSRIARRRRPIDREPVPARFLRLVHRQIGRRQDFEAREAVEQRDADAGGDRNLLFGEHRRCRRSAFTMPSATTSAWPAPTCGRMMPNSSPPSRARTSVSRIRLAQRGGDGLEQVVARLVAELVVDGLEVIQIDQQHRPAAAIAGRRLGFLGQRLLEAPAVEQRGQKIVVDEMIQMRLRALSARRCPEAAR